MTLAANPGRERAGIVRHSADVRSGDETEFHTLGALSFENSRFAGPIQLQGLSVSAERRFQE
jgi:hypothetical protein